MLCLVFFFIKKTDAGLPRCHAIFIELTTALTYPHPLFLGLGDKIYNFSSPAPERNMLGRSFLKKMKQ